MKTISRTDSAFFTPAAKGDAASEAGVLIRPLCGRSPFQAIKEINAEIVAEFGATHGLYTEDMRAGVLSRTLRTVSRVGDNQFGVVQDQHTLRDGLVPTGAYRRSSLNPYNQREWHGGGYAAHKSFSINQGRFLSEHLEQGESCVVKLPSGRFITMEDSFLAFSLEAPVLVGTHFYKGPRGGAEACLTGSRCTNLSVAGVPAGQYWRLGADTEAIVKENNRTQSHGPNSQFQVGPTAQVMSRPVAGKRLSIDNIKIALDDGEMLFSSLSEVRVTSPDIFLSRNASTPEKFVEDQLHYALKALLSGSLTFDWFASLAHAKPNDVPSRLQNVIRDAVTRVTHACTRAGITLEQLSITPQWSGKFAEGVDAVNAEKIAATVKAVTEEARVAKHPYDKLEAARGLDLDIIEAQKPTHKARMRIFEALMANRNFDRAI